jgi:DNA-binding CsgD family transcriptional regulator
MAERPGDVTSRLQLVLAALLVVITAAASADLAMDRPDSLLSLHVLAELTVVATSLTAAAYLAWGWYASYRVMRDLQAAVVEGQAERDVWRQRAGRVLRSLSRAVDDQFSMWGLTDAERETALMLLKGHSHKRIARLSGRSERTVRQHAVAVYRKAGLAGRSELSAFFLDDLLSPGDEHTDLDGT